MKKLLFVLAGLAALGLIVAANAPGARLARGYIFRGDSSNVSAAFDANGNGQILVGDGTDLLSSDVSGDVELTSAGATTIQANAVETTMMYPGYTITFNEGASKGVAILADTGLAYSTTADAHNKIYYGRHSLNYVTVTTATGTMTPAADAEGLDITAGAPGDNDALAIYGNYEGASGQPFTIGTSAAFKFCVTVKFHDVTGSDHFYCGFRTIQAPDDPVSQYTDYCAIGHISGNYGVQDKTTGATDAGSSTIADDATDTLCTLVSSTGACTYTIDGSAPNATDAHTLGDGILVIPFCDLRHASDLADDTWITSWAVDFQ